MFTLKFVSPDLGAQDVHQVERYSINEMPNDDSLAVGTRTIRLYRTADGNPMFRYIGPEERYDVAYVTNSEGQTIDTLR